MTRYITERVDGVWRVRDTICTHGDGSDCAVVYGPGSGGAAAARAGAERLNRTNESKPGNEVRAWRTARGLSQARLAKLLGIQPLAVLRWENGTRTPPPFLRMALQHLERELESTA